MNKGEAESVREFLGVRLSEASRTLVIPDWSSSNRIGIPDRGKALESGLRKEVALKQAYAQL